MFRISQLLEAVHSNVPFKSPRKALGPVVIWNLLRRCNLTCKHCYSTSANIDFKGELDTHSAKQVIDELDVANVPVIIFSGGEPLMRPDIFELTKYAKKKGFFVALSTNGTLITEDNIEQIKQADFQYVGISLDGNRETHDAIRQLKGSYDLSLEAVKLCKKARIKVGLRFTLTQDNAHELPDMLDIVDRLDVDKFYLSHLNYSGRGVRNSKRDAMFKMTRDAMELLYERAFSYVAKGISKDFVTGNNDADGPFMLQWAKQYFDAEQVENLATRLKAWGGNSTGVNIANIDNQGMVHPDTYWWNVSLGSLKEKTFSDIWNNTDNELMKGLRQSPRPVKGRCAKCKYFDMCGGNTRTRAFAKTGDAWGEDPGCYLDDKEIGIISNDIPCVSI